MYSREWGIICHMRSQCSLSPETGERAPLEPQPSKPVLDLPNLEGSLLLNWPWWWVIYQDALPVGRESPIQVLSRPFRDQLHTTIQTWTENYWLVYNTHFLIIIDLRALLGVIIVNNWLCPDVHLSVCHASSNCFFFVSRWNRVIFGRYFSMCCSTKRCSSIFDLGPLTPKIYPPTFAQNHLYNLYGLYGR